jgi:hypothetical protein
MSWKVQPLGWEKVQDGEQFVAQSQQLDDGNIQEAGRLEIGNIFDVMITLLDCVRKTWPKHQ